MQAWVDELEPDEFSAETFSMLGFHQQLLQLPVDDSRPRFF